MEQHTPTQKQQIVLIGGGHTHALFLRNWARQFNKCGQLTLISPSTHTPYSGMLPGQVAGHFRAEETHIDLTALCRHANAAFVEAHALTIDPNRRQITLSNNRMVSYDILSINVGAAPSLAIPGTLNRVIPVKPISEFFRTWTNLLDKLTSAIPPNKITIAVVGGGASGVELIQAIDHRLKKLAPDKIDYRLSLLQRRRGQPENYPAKFQRAFAERLQARGIEVYDNFSVCRVEDTGTASLLRATDGRSLEADHVFWCTHAIGAQWLKNTCLPLDDKGFIQVKDTLQSVNHPQVFACGDCASMMSVNTPKAGVFAVRQAKTLTHNILALLNGTPLASYTPQKNYLSIVTGGDQWALASRGDLSLPKFGARLIWKWKRHIDKKFMRQFEGLENTDVE